MARANMQPLADLDVTPLPPREPAAAAATAAEPRVRRSTSVESTGEPEEALGVDVPRALKRELKSESASNGEKMKHVVARAIRRELDRMKESR